MFYDLINLHFLCNVEKKEGEVHLLRRGGGGEKMPKGGIEPPTRGFSVHCSAD